MGVGGIEGGGGGGRGGDERGWRVGQAHLICCLKLS